MLVFNTFFCNIESKYVGVIKKRTKKGSKYLWSCVFLLQVIMKSLFFFKFKAEDFLKKLVFQNLIFKLGFFNSFLTYIVILSSLHI